MTLSTHILQVLRRVGDKGLPASVLAVELRVRLGRPPGEIEIEDALNQLKDKELVRDQEDDVTGDVRWSLTWSGKEKAK